MENEIKVDDRVEQFLERNSRIRITYHKVRFHNQI